MQRLFSTVLVAFMALAAGALAQTLSLTNTLPNPNPEYQFGDPDQFGGAVAVVGNNILVGASGEDTGALNAGAAYLFDGNTGKLLFPIYKTTPAADERFGAAVAAVGNNLLIGAPGAGEVYLFDGATGDLLHTFSNPNPNLPNSDAFGQAVAAVGNNILIGAPGFNAGTVSAAGAVYLFEFDESTNTAALRLTLYPKAEPPFTSPFGGADQFGSAVAWIGNNMLIGAPGDDNVKGSHAGAAYLFDGSTGAHLYTFLNPSTTLTDNARFGAAIAVAGNYILIGAPTRQSSSAMFSGTAYLFDATTYASIREFSNPSATSFSQFSASVTAFGSNVFLVIGAPHEAPTGVSNAGQAYLYDANNSEPLQELNQNPNENAQFGTAVAAGGGHIAVAAPEAEAGAGEVYLYLSNQNQPPVADAGPDQNVECTSPVETLVTLDGSASTDPDNDQLTYTWRENGDIIAGPTTSATAQVTVGMASRTIQLTVEDGNGGTATDEVVINVVDTTPPTITLLEPTSLWPANRKYVTVSVTQCVASVSEACAGSIPVSEVKIAAVSSDEPDNALEHDIVIAGDCRSVDLRADREKFGNGRVYTIELTVTDLSGNVATASYTVAVPAYNNQAAVDDGPLYTEISHCESVSIAKTSNGSENGEAREMPEMAAPESYALAQNYPNPFNPTTDIRFALPEASHVTVKIFNALGKNIRTLADKNFAAGSHTVRWNAKNELGEKVPSGIYFYQLVTPRFSETKRMILTK